MLTDVRLAIRRLASSPGASLVAIVSLGLGIGANSAVFGVADALLLRPLPYPDADRIGIVWQRSPGLNVAQDWLSLGQYADIRDDARSFDMVATAIGTSVNLTGAGTPERVDGMRASSSFFRLFGGRAEQGRVFDSTDDVPGKPLGVILTHAFWMRRFGGDRTLVGRTIQLSGSSIEVVGITSPDFVITRDVMPAVNALQRVDIILPLPLPASIATVRGGEDYVVFTRLKHGVKATAAQAELDGLAAKEKQLYPGRYPPSGGLTLSLVSLRDQVVGDVGLIVRLLLGASALVLLIACANVANLSLSRAAVQQRELAIRAAVGAGRGELVRQLIAESVVRSLAGGLVGLLLAMLGIMALKTFGSANIPRLEAIGIHPSMLAFTFLVALISGVAVGIIPGVHAANTDPGDVLRQAAVRFGHPRLRRILAGAEIALSLMLLIGAVLLVRSYQRLTSADPGFDEHDLLTLRLSVGRTHYPDGHAVNAFYRELEDRLRTLPGVTHVGENYQLPFSSVSLAWEPINVEGYVPRVAGDTVVISNSAYVSADYFRAMGIALVNGRFFNETDADGPPVIIVDDHLAKRFWPGADPLGRRIRQGATGPWRTVVGVVANTRQFDLVPQPPITVFFPIEQFAITSRFVVVRGSPATALIVPALRTIQALDPDLPAYDVSTMTQRLSDALSRRRLAMLLLGCFAALAGVLAVVGVYGVVAYWVAQRTREIGIRVALGASRSSVYQLISRELVLILGAGLVVGIAGALALTRLLNAMLFGVGAEDPATFIAALLMLAAAAVLAAWIPARRAVGVSPLIALRTE